MPPELATPASLKPRRGEGFFRPTIEAKENLRSKTHEKIIVISDLHGAKDEVIARLNAIPRQGQEKPAAVILGGDVVGNPDLEELQKLFYNGVINHVRAAISENPQITDQELLNYRSANSPQGFSLREGFKALRRKEMELEGLTAEGLSGEKAERRDALTAQLDDDDAVAKQIRSYQRDYVHYGHYVSNLHPDAVKKLAEGLRENAEKLATPLKELQESGVKVFVNEGNWDPSPPIAFERGIPEARRLTARQQQEATSFSTQVFFEQQGIPYVTRMEVVETETAALVLLPFDQLIAYGDMESESIRDAVSEQLAMVKEAREQKDKQVIVIQHGEVMWEPHNLTDPHSQPKGEHAKVIAGSTKINTLLQPDEILHGHFHDPYVDESGTPQDINTKYAVVFDAGAPVIIPPRHHAQGQSVVTYMPLQRFATIQIPFDNSNYGRRIQNFGGTRSPAVVS